MAKPRNNHCANCIGTLSFPIPAGGVRPFVHLLSLAFLAALTLRAKLETMTSTGSASDSFEFIGAI